MRAAAGRGEALLLQGGLRCLWGRAQASARTCADRSTPSPPPCPTTTQLGEWAAALALAAALHEGEPLAGAAEEALWSLFLRCPSTEMGASMQTGVVLMRRPECWDQALALFDGMVAQAPTFAEGYNKRATVLYLQGRYAEAIEDCKVRWRLGGEGVLSKGKSRRLCSLCTGSPDAWRLHRPSSLTPPAHSSRLPSSAAQVVLSLNPYHFMAASGMGLCCAAVGDVPGAIAGYQHALALNPRMRHLRAHVGQLQAQLAEERSGGEPQ